MKKTYMTPKMLITVMDSMLMQVIVDSQAYVKTDSDGTGDGSDAAAKQITLDFESDDEDEL